LEELRMRVLHVVDSLAGSGGAERGLVREITRFSPDVDQVVVRLFERDELEPQLTQAGIEVISLGLRAASASRVFPFAALKLAKVIRSVEPDVVHTSLFTGNLVGQMAARLTGTPVVSTFVLSGDLALLRATQPGAASRKASVMRWLASVTAQWSKPVFRALTEDARQTNSELLGIDPETVTVIPRGAPERISNSMSRAELGLPEEVPLAVNVARLAAQKGQVFLLRAFAIAAERHPDVRLVIVGKGGDAEGDVRAEVVNLGLQDRVTLLGYTPHARHVLSHASVFVFTSLMEGLGTAVLEALAAGIPVVAFDIPPVREATDGGRAAHLVQQGNVAGIAEGIVDALKGRLDDRAAHGMEFISNRGDLESIAARLEALLRQTAGQ
jgi:glycosyltransferase involved in cell wall biosynthesis